MATESLRLHGPNEKWRELVSGTVVENYAIAQAMWTQARGARLLLGREQKMPDDATKIKQPLWGSDKTAISKWAYSVVSFGATQKLAIRFEIAVLS